jgi:hypothetical protein
VPDLEPLAQVTETLLRREEGAAPATVVAAGTVAGVVPAEPLRAAARECAAPPPLGVAGAATTGTAEG